MDENQKLNIEISEQFPHLSHAPIQEAVIEVRAYSDVPLNETELLQILTKQLPDYNEHHSLRSFASQIEFAQGQEPKFANQDFGWQGFQFNSQDKKNIVKFQMGLFSFSRLEPYENWEKFSNEALRLWKIHSELFCPIEIERMGVRFINRFLLPQKQTVRVSEYFRAQADDLPELNPELIGFLHHETMILPGHHYAMNVIKTAQSSETSGIEPAFILDIDVYTLQPFVNDSDSLTKRLAEMHWLKNKAFFGIITDNLKDKLKT